MKRILMMVEGQTEFTFVNLTLKPYFQNLEIYITAKMVTTSRIPSGKTFKGGVVSYQQVKNDLASLLHDTNAAAVTTLLDFYHLPSDFPGYKTLPKANCYKRVAHLEKAFAEDIAYRHFIPHLMLHEFETILFASPETIADAFSSPDQLVNIQAMIAKFNGIEELNEQLPPSKRLINFYPDYRKTADGPLIADAIGIQRIRDACPHLNHWLTRLEQIGTAP